MCDEALLDKTIEKIRRDPDALVFIMGDVMDSIAPHDKRFEAGLVAEWVDTDDVLGSQVNYAWEKLKPIAKKIIGILDGNHEEKVKKEYSFRMKLRLIEKAAEQKIFWKDLSYSALVMLQFFWKNSKNNKTEYSNPLTIYLHHGYGGGRGASDAGHFKDISSAYDADWILMGHTHKKFANESVYYRINRAGELVEERRLWGRTSSFLKTIDKCDQAGYGEQKGYLPTPRGALCIKYYPHPNADSTPRGWVWLND